jgi:O-antigen ligase
MAVVAAVRVLGSSAPAARYQAVVVLVGVAALGYLAAHTHPAWLLSAGVLLTTFASNWGYLGMPQSIAPDRFVLVAGILAVVLRLPSLKDRLSLGLHPVHWLIGLAGAYAIGSAIAVGTIGDKDAVFRIVDRFGLVPFALFLAVPLVFRTARHRDLFLGALVAWGGYLGLTSLFETVGPDALVVPKYILDPNVGIHFGRARGPFVEAVSNGLALYGCAVAGVIALLTWRGAWARFGACVVVALCTLGVLFTLQRSVWVGAAAGTLVVLLLVRELRRFAVPALVGAALLLGGAVVAIPGLAGRINDRASNQRTVWDRQNLNRAGLNMIAARPLLGFGWEQFQVKNTDYFQLGDNIPLTVSRGTALHNMFVGNAAELGLIGTSLWALALVFGVGGAMFVRGPPELRPWKIGLAAFAVCWVVSANFSYLLAFPTLLLWVWAGIVWSYRTSPSAPSDSEIRRDRAASPV